MFVVDSNREGKFYRNVLLFLFTIKRDICNINFKKKCTENLVDKPDSEERWGPKP